MHDHDTQGECHAAIYTKRAQTQDTRRREGYKQKVSFNEPRSKSLKMWTIKWHPKGKIQKSHKGVNHSESGALGTQEEQAQETRERKLGVPTEGEGTTQA